jgi:hypothetical protein
MGQHSKPLPQVGDTVTCEGWPGQVTEVDAENDRFYVVGAGYHGWFTAEEID